MKCHHIEQWSVTILKKIPNKIAQQDFSAKMTDWKISWDFFMNSAILFVVCISMPYGKMIQQKFITSYIDYFNLSYAFLENIVIEITKLSIFSMDSISCYKNSLYLPKRNIIWFGSFKSSDRQGKKLCMNVIDDTKINSSDNILKCSKNHNTR